VDEFLKKFLEQSQQPIEWLGYLAQFVFFFRFAVQWYASERRKESVIPEAFWWISLAGGLLTLSYGLLKVLPPIVLAQLGANLIYARNLVLVRRAKQRRAQAPSGSSPAHPPDA
jgi:lipid-A-disaccharide synthase-like uncharacterized protein